MIQKEALCGALADILWRAGGGKSCVLCLPSKTAYLSGSNNFNQDGVTEKVDSSFFIVPFNFENVFFSLDTVADYQFRTAGGVDNDVTSLPLHGRSDLAGIKIVFTYRSFSCSFRKSQALAFCS